MGTAEDARLALYCMAAEDRGPAPMPPYEPSGAAFVGPAPPAWVLDGHTLLGWLTGQDSWLEGILNLRATRVFYAWVLKGDSGATVVIRGTEGAAEWAIDSEVVPMTAHGVAGMVETGFWSLYCTLEFRDLTGRDMPIAEGLPDGATVAGHSLGAAVATYLTLELAELGRPTRGRFIASPHPGDQAFAQYFASTVRDYVVYAYARDIVPQVPGGMGYCHLPNLVTLPSSQHVRDTIACNHHAASYAHEIEPGALSILPPGANRFASCLIP